MEKPDGSVCRALAHLSAGIEKFCYHSKQEFRLIGRVVKITSKTGASETLAKQSSRREKEPALALPVFRF